MEYEFIIVASRTSLEPAKSYFASVRDAATRAVSTMVVSQEQAEVVCEYLDCVDGHDIPLEPLLYRQSMGVLCAYLEDATDGQAAKLAARSWAAKTILELNIRGAYTPPALYVVPAMQRAA